MRGTKASVRIRPRRCWCCRSEYRESGCVRGFVCRCLHGNVCVKCCSCEEHCKCAEPELYADWVEAVRAMFPDQYRRVA
jgi:hypothetical protein